MKINLNWKKSNKIVVLFVFLPGACAKIALASFKGLLRFLGSCPAFDNWLSNLARLAFALSNMRWKKQLKLNNTLNYDKLELNRTNNFFVKLNKFKWTILKTFIEIGFLLSD